MHPRKCLIIYAAVLLVGLRSALGLPGIAPIFTNATWSGNQFQFTLRGETNVSYIIESSSDLNAWTFTVTNSEPNATRTVIVPATSAQGFWRVRPVPGPLFEYAILAQSRVTLGGSGWINSFDSTDPNYATPDRRYDPIRPKAAGHVVCLSRTASALNIGNRRVAGFAATGPGGTITLGPNGGVGSLIWLTNPANAGMVEPGYHRDDLRIVLPEARLPTPFGPAVTPSAGIFGGTNYTYVLTNGDYRMQSMTLGSGEKMLVTGKVRIHVVGPTTLSGSGYILLNRDASIEWYAAGRVTLSGSGCINSSGLATDFSIIGLTTNAVSYTGSAPLIGTVYAPTAPVTLLGVGDAVGAVVGNTVEIAGGVSLHFDEYLRRAGPFN